VIFAFVGFVIAAEINPDEPSAVASCDDLANFASHRDFLLGSQRRHTPRALHGQQSRFLSMDCKEDDCSAGQRHIIGSQEAAPGRKTVLVTSSGANLNVFSEAAAVRLLLCLVGFSVPALQIAKAYVQRFVSQPNPNRVHGDAFLMKCVSVGLAETM